MGFLYNFDGHFLTPGMGVPATEVVNPHGAQWGRLFDMKFLSAQIDGSSRDTGNTGYTSVLRPGLVLGKVASSGKLKQWDPTATDGTAKPWGILAHAMAMTQSGTDQDRFSAMVYVGGSITPQGVLVPGNTAYGLDGDDEEYNLRAQLSPGFVFSDDPLGCLTGKAGGVMIAAASATLSEIHNGNLIVVRGATGAVTLTLPASPKKGLRYRIQNVSDQNLILAAGTADTMVVFNDLTADSVALQTAGDLIGGGFEVIGDGTGWLVIPHVWSDGVIVQTLTIAT